MLTPPQLKNRMESFANDRQKPYIHLDPILRTLFLLLFIILLKTKSTVIVKRTGLGVTMPPSP